MDVLHRIPGDRRRKCSWEQVAHWQSEGSTGRNKSCTGKEGSLNLWRAGCLLSPTSHSSHSTLHAHTMTPISHTLRTYLMAFTEWKADSVSRRPAQHVTSISGQAYRILKLRYDSNHYPQYTHFNFTCGFGRVEASSDITALSRR